jgi:hypothetical protein
MPALLNLGYGGKLWSLPRELKDFVNPAPKMSMETIWTGMNWSEELKIGFDNGK